jgi:hypothetical protein
MTLPLRAHVATEFVGPAVPLHSAGARYQTAIATFLVLCIALTRGYSTASRGRIFYDRAVLRFR